MNQSEYLNLSRKRKRTTKQIDEERKKSLEKNTIYRGGLDEQTREWVRGTKRNKLGPSKLGPTKSSETIRDRIANKLDQDTRSNGDFHARRTKAITVSGKKVDQKTSTATTLSGRRISVTHDPKQDIRMHKQKHKGRSR